MLYSSSFIIMALVNLFTVSSFGSFFLFPLFVTRHGGSESDIGIIMGVFALSGVLCRPWISEMIDRIGRKRSYTIGCAIMAVLPLGYLLFDGDLSSFYLSLILIRIIHGVGLAICFTAAFTYIADIIPKERLNEGIGIFGLTGLAGQAVGPSIAEIIIQKYGFSIFFLAATGTASIGFLLHLLLPESFAHASGTSPQAFFSVLRKKRVLTVGLLAFLFGFGLAASSSFVSPFSKERGIAFISIYYLSYSSAAVLTRFVGGRVADKIGEERVIPYALILTGGGLLILTFLGGDIVLILSGLVSGCGHGFLFPSLNSLAVRKESSGIRGKITGVFTGAIDTGTLVGSIILGYIGEWAGFPALFFVAGLALFMGFGIYEFRIMNSKGLAVAKGVDEK